MSKIPCNVIRDLMVLYEDDVCSEESRQMVDSHIQECENCRKVYQMAEQPLPKISVEEKEGGDDNKNDDEFWELAQRAVKKFERKLTYKNVIIVSIIVLTVIFMDVIWENWLQYRMNAVPAEEIEIIELYELENGDIYCTFTCKDLIGAVNVSELKVPEGKRFRDSDEGWYEVSFQYPKFYEKRIAEKVYDNQRSIIFKKKVRDIRNWVEDEDGHLIPDESAIASTQICTAIYYNEKDKKNSRLVWEESQAIKSAPKAIEKEIKKEKADHEFYDDYSVWIIH